MTDSLKLYETLKSAAFSEPQARAITAAIGCALEGQAADYDKSLAAKIDVNKFDADMHQIEIALTQRISNLQVVLTEKISELGQKISDTNQALRDEMHANYKASNRWTFAFWAGQLATTIGIVFLVIKLLR